MSSRKKAETNRQDARVVISVLIFAFVALIVLAIARAGSSRGTVYLEARGSTTVSLKADADASGNSFIQFGGDTGGGGGNGTATGEVQPRSSFPVRNTVFDTQQYSELPSAQIPTDLSNSFVTSGTFPFGFMNSEFGSGPRAGFDNISAFRTWCSYSHLSYDDPVVFPGQKGAAHLHMFFGNTLADYNSNGDSILNKGASTCDGGALNRTSYWIPAMMNGSGDVVIPRWLFIYYKTFDHVGITARPIPTTIDPFETGLGFVSKGVGSQPDIDFWCGPVTFNVRNELHRQTIPDCGAGGRMTQRVKFPFCWDGRINSEDNSHMVMPTTGYTQGICPATHPKRIPSIEYQLEYTITGGSTANWHLSSDVDPATNQKTEPDGSTAHGDWLNGWNKVVNRMWNEGCTKVNNDCTQNVYKPDSRWFFKFHNKARFNGVGSNIIPASEINKLCPGDVDRGPYDGAYCQSALRGLASTQGGEGGHNHDHGDKLETHEIRYGGAAEDAPASGLCTEALIAGEDGTEECSVLLDNN